MSGVFMHAPQFDRLPYIGSDGQEHYELQYPAGHDEVVAYSSWNEAVSYFASEGISKDLWPVFEGGIDLPLERIHTLSLALQRAVGDLSPSDSPRLVRIIVTALERKEDIVYCM